MRNLKHFASRRSDSLRPSTRASCVWSASLAAPLPRMARRAILPPHRVRAGLAIARGLAWASACSAMNILGDALRDTPDLRWRCRPRREEDATSAGPSRTSWPTMRRLERSRSRSPRRAARGSRTHPRDAGRRGAGRRRRLLPAQLREPGPRAGRRSCDGGGPAGLVRLHLARGATGVPRVRAVQHRGAQRLHRPEGRRVPRRTRPRARRART